jgi:mannose-1-phosphate guanylyltransferase/phosphomannomutase
MASLCKLLELLAPVDRPLSELVAGLPEPTLLHRRLQCPWALKGTVMRVLNERLADRDLDLTDGIKLFDERGWVQVLPDADEPLIHIYAEGSTAAESEALEVALHHLVDEVLAGDEVETSTRG